MSEAKKLFTGLLEHVSRLGRLIQGKEADAANKVRQLRPSTRTRQQVMEEYSRAINEIGGRTVNIDDNQRKIDMLTARCAELRAEDEAIARAEAAKAPTDEAPATEAKEPA